MRQYHQGYEDALDDVADALRGRSGDGCGRGCGCLLSACGCLGVGGVVMQEGQRLFGKGTLGADFCFALGLALALTLLGMVADGRIRSGKAPAVLFCALFLFFLCAGFFGSKNRQPNEQVNAPPQAGAAPSAAVSAAPSQSFSLPVGNADAASELVNRANQALGKSDFDRAIADSSAAIRLDSRNVIAYLIRGEAYRFKNDLDRAIADANEALRPPEVTPTGARVIWIKLLRTWPRPFDSIRQIK
jgi:tetratricopeptide (TPR) repeat protein